MRTKENLPLLGGGNHTQKAKRKIINCTGPAIGLLSKGTAAKNRFQFNLVFQQYKKCTNKLIG
jgi:hypothetical protein